MHTDMTLACSPQASKTISTGLTALYGEIAADQLNSSKFERHTLESIETWPSTLPVGAGLILA